MLIVESENASARAIKRAIRRNPAFDCDIDRVRRQNEVSGRLINQDVDVILIGPSHFDSDEGEIPEFKLRNLGPEVLVLPLPMRRPRPGPGRRQLDMDWMAQVLRYVAQRKQVEDFLWATEDALCEEKEQARVALNAVNDAVLLCNGQGRITLMNPVAESLTGWSSQDATGRPVEEVFNVISSLTRTPPDHPVLRSLREDRAMATEPDWVLIRQNGEELGVESSLVPIHNRDGWVTGAVLVFRDIHHSPIVTEKMAYLAHHDSLTGLPNRTLLDERLEQAISLAKRHRKQTALLYLDLDDFKGINDALGHATGDRVLQLVADKLKGCVRATDTVCRQGGDEFVILLNEIENPQDAAQVAEKILAAFAAPLMPNGQELHLRLSIGISVFPDDGDSVDTILRQADAAMYFAKMNHDVSYGFARGDLDHWFKGAETMEHRLFRAFEADEFVLHYQPQIDLVSGKIIGVEALVRWNDPDRGLVFPGEFMPIAEQSGLIVAIGRWVIQQACRQVAAWGNGTRPVLPVAINVSGPEFEHSHFVTFIQEVLRETGIEPDKLELEFTESVLVNDPEKSKLRLQQLSDIGIRLAVDDFGAVGSSLRYLRHFPVDTLKIDQSLMSDITADPATSVVLRSLVNVGKGLKRRMVAEGIETASQLGFVQAQLFDVAQGFRFAAPQDAAGFSQLLESQQS
ncbi:MAG: putative bifunctional diguanylate cyclase/phosphodiesterase [Pseudomonadota bacterium]